IATSRDGNYLYGVAGGRFTTYATSSGARISSFATDRREVLLVAGGRHRALAEEVPVRDARRHGHPLESVRKLLDLDPGDALLNRREEAVVDVLADPARALAAIGLVKRHRGTTTRQLQERAQPHQGQVDAERERPGQKAPDGLVAHA